MVVVVVVVVVGGGGGGVAGGNLARRFSLCIYHLMQFLHSSKRGTGILGSSSTQDWLAFNYHSSGCFPSRLGSIKCSSEAM